MAVVDTSGMEAMIDPMTGEIMDEKGLAEQLLAQVREQGVSLIGLGGVLSGLTGQLLEAALNEELTEYLGHEHEHSLLGDREALGDRVGRVRALPRIRRRDPPSDLCHERDRVDQRPLPPGRARQGHFPNEQSALKCLYLVTRSLDPTGGERARWTMRWKPALNAFAITFADRLKRTTN